jgi:hypothetical protein
LPAVKFKGIAAVVSLTVMMQSGPNTQLMAGAATSTTVSLAAFAAAHGAAISAAAALQRTMREASML